MNQLRWKRELSQSVLHNCKGDTPFIHVQLLIDLKSRETRPGQTQTFRAKPSANPTRQSLSTVSLSDSSDWSGSAVLSGRPRRDRSQTGVRIRTLTRTASRLVSVLLM